MFLYSVWVQFFVLKGQTIVLKGQKIVPLSLAFVRTIWYNTQHRKGGLENERRKHTRNHCRNDRQSPRVQHSERGSGCTRSPAPADPSGRALLAVCRMPDVRCAVVPEDVRAAPPLDASGRDGVRCRTAAFVPGARAVALQVRALGQGGDGRAARIRTRRDNARRVRGGVGLSVVRVSRPLGRARPVAEAGCSRTGGLRARSGLSRL